MKLLLKRIRMSVMIIFGWIVLIPIASIFALFASILVMDRPWLVFFDLCKDVGMDDFWDFRLIWKEWNREG